MSWTKVLKLRTVCNKLRIDPNDGTPALEYRIQDGRVERRTVETPALDGAATEAQWQQLTTEQLASHVMANTVVAHWLYCRLGIFSLLRAVGQLLASVNKTQEFPRPRSLLVPSYARPTSTLRC
jgi:hypothetical protein